MFSSNSWQKVHPFLNLISPHAGLLLFQCHMSVNVASCLSVGVCMRQICILWSNLVHTFIPPSHNLMTHSQCDIWNVFQCVSVRVCVALCWWVTSSCHETINPGYNKPFSCEGQGKMKLSCADSEGYWSQLCNLKWLLCYYFSCTLWPR